MSSLKQQLLRGAKHTEQLHVPELVTDEFDGNLTVRGLTEGEEAEAEEAAVAGQVVRGKVGARPTDTEVDVAASAKGQMLARRIVVAHGLSVDGEKWTPAEVAKLPPAAVARIHRKVKRMTGDGGDDIDSFRGERGGADDGGPAPDGDAARGDAG